LDTPRGIDPVFAARLPRKVPLSYHDGTKGRPTARRMITEMTDAQSTLADLFHIHQYAPTR
jgi:hypothetical protein